MTLRTPHDDILAKGAHFSIQSQENFGGEIEFQFPPRILSDNRKGNWNDGNLPGTEPVAVYATSSPREFSLSWTYIVENHITDTGLIHRDDITGNFRGEWSIKKIKNQINLLRGYFSNLRASDRDALFVYFKYPYLTGIKIWTCRMLAVDVKHGDTLVGGKEWDDLVSVFPLRTDINVSLKLWTTGIRESDDQNKILQDVNGMSPEPSPEDLWY